MAVPPLIEYWTWAPSPMPGYENVSVSPLALTDWMRSSTTAPAFVSCARTVIEPVATTTVVRDAAVDVPTWASTVGSTKALRLRQADP